MAEGAGTYYAYGSAAAHGCYGRLTGTPPYVVGRPVWYVVGRIAAPVKLASGNQRLTSVYPYSLAGAPPLVATEQDIISKTSERVLATTVTVAPTSGHHFPAYRYSAHYSYPAAVPSAPRVDLCK